MQRTECPILKGKTREEEIQTCLNCPLPHCVSDFPHGRLLPDHLPRRAAGKMLKKEEGIDRTVR